MRSTVRLRRAHAALAMVLAALAALGGACREDEPAVAAIALTLPLGAVTITSVEVTIRDELGACVGPDVGAGGGVLLMTDVTVNEPRAVRVTSGVRVLSARALRRAVGRARGRAR